MFSALSFVLFFDKSFYLFYRFNIECPCICIKGQDIAAGGEVEILVAVGIVFYIVDIYGTIRIGYLVAVPGAVAVIHNLELYAVVGIAIVG